MNSIAGRFPRAAARTALALALALSLAACASPPELAIVSPAPGSALGPTVDLDPSTPGLQIAVDATTSAADGSDGFASAGGPPAHTTAQGGHFHFASVTFADGATTLTVAAVDKVHDKHAVATANYSVDTFVSGCRISTPADHSTLSSDPGDTGLVSVVVQAICHGLSSTTQVGLLENQDAQPSQLQLPQVDGSVTFTAELIPGTNLLSVVAVGGPYDSVEVTLASSRCRAELVPSSGARFNLDGAGGAIADTDPSTAGVQANLAVTTDCPDGTPASLSLQSGGTVQLTANSTVQGGSAVFPVTLPDGTLEVQAFVGAPGSEGASRAVTYQSDGTEPAIAILSPVSGGLLGPQDNVGTGAQFVARVRGQISGLDSNGYAALELDQGTAGAMEIPVTPDLTTGIFTSDVALSEGQHQLFAKVQRASGNLATAPTVAFTVVVNGSALAIVTPADGTEVGLSQLVPEGGGAQLTFLLQSAGLVGANATLSCGTGLTGTATIGADGSASIPLVLPITSCAGALFHCTASADAGATVAPAISFTADDTAPVVTILAPTANAIAGATTEVSATTSCPGEGQFYTLSDNGSVVASGTVQGNAIDLASVPLQGGQHELQVTVTDAAQNSGSAEVEIQSSTNAFPNTSFVTPTSGAVYGPTASQISCTSGKPVLEQVQVQVTGDTVDPSGMVLKLTNSTGTQTLAQTPTVAGDVFTWTNLQLAPESNQLAVTATDPENQVGQASVSFTARCTSLGVALLFVANGTHFGYAQDTDHSTPGLQIGAQVTSTATNGSSVRLCTTALSATPGGCATAGTGAVAVVSGTAAIQSGVASFTVTLPDGPQSVYAEVTDVGTEASSPDAVTVRSVPPTVASIALSEDTQGQALNSGPDGALNQAEMDAAAGGNAHFQVVFGTNSFVAGQTVQIFSTSSATSLGSATVAQDGDGTTATPVPVPLSALNPGGYQSYVFYALVSDDADNKDSTPSTPVAGVAATTLGTAADPFVIAPEPTLSLTAPVPGVGILNASADVRCANGICPDTDPLVYPFAATTDAPDSSVAGAASAIGFLENGAAIVAGVGETNPTPTSGSAVSDVELPIANGTAVALAAQVLDPYGNLATSAANTVLVDSVPPELAITAIDGNSTSGGTVDIDEPTVEVAVSIDATGAGTLEDGQGVAIYADGALAGSAAYQGSSTGAGSVSISITVGSGSHTLVAQAIDLAGNTGASPPAGVLQTYSGPTLALSQPAPVSGGTLWFGLSSKSGSGGSQICAPSLTFTTSNVPDGNSVLVWLIAANASCASPVGNVQTATVSSNSATLPTASFAIADGATGRLCAQTSDGVNTVEATAQSYQCDLETPTVAWVSPSAGQSFVAYGQTQIAGATPSTSSDNTKLGLASAQLTVSAPTGGTLTLSVDQDNTPTVKTTQFVSCGVAPTSGAQSLYALAVNNCSTTSGTGQLLAPVDYAQLLAHTLTATFTAPSGNAATAATQSVNIDVAEPAAVSPAFTVQHAIGVVAVTIPTLPGDDQTVGGNPAAWDVRYSPTALTASNWSTGTLVTANLAGTFPTGVPSSFQAVLPSGNQTLYLGVRAKDRVGNLGDLVSGSVVQIDTQPTGSTVAIKDDSGSAPTTPGLYAESMRVADVDGDGYDDVVLSYSYARCGEDGYCYGRVIVYFGGPGGISNPSAPLVLGGTIYEGYLGITQSFDVGDFDADGKADIAAAETDFVSAHVLIWTGASIAAWRSAGSSASSPPTPIVLSDGTDESTLVGGTVRAVGHITGGSGAGDDLAISNYSFGDGTSAPYYLALLQRGGAWSKSGATNVFSTGSPATAIIQLPDDVAGLSSAPTDSSYLEAAPFTYVGASGDLPGLALTLSYDATAPTAHETYLFGGDQIAASMQWSVGTALANPSGVGATDFYGFYMVGGRDAVGDSHTDLLIADSDTGVLFLYDGASLLGPSAPAAPSPILALNSKAESSANNALGAVLLPDLDGDGKAELAGGIDPAGAPVVDLWFGETGDNTAPAALPFFGSCTTPSALEFCFTPPRGQHIQGAPLLSGTLPFGQRVGSGHVTSLVGRDLVILSQPDNPAGQSSSVSGMLVLLR